MKNILRFLFEPWRDALVARRELERLRGHYVITKACSFKVYDGVTSQYHPLTNGDSICMKLDKKGDSSEDYVPVLFRMARGTEARDYYGNGLKRLT
jgi:hypothetical protein